MKLQNKKTGKAVILQNRDDLRVVEDYHIYINIYDGSVDLLYKEDDEYQKHYHYSTFEMFRLKWKEYEEPTTFWYICGFEVMPAIEGKFSTPDLAAFTREEIAKLEDIGNYFETEEEANKAVEKMKARERLISKGARFKGWFWDKNYGTCILIGTSEGDCVDDFVEQSKKDLDLLFGGEE